MEMFKEHDIVELIDDYSKRELPKGSMGVVVYSYPSNDVYEVEFNNGIVLTLQHYQINLKEKK